MASHLHHHGEHHGHVHLDEAEWRAWAAQIEAEGELFLSFVTDTAAWVRELRGADAPAVRRIVDIGSGPGVGSCELARLFPDAQVTAVDSSPAMLDRTSQRVAARGLGARISTHLADLPGGLEGFGSVDMIWASMALHHIGDEVAALQVLGDRLGSYGLLAIAELGEPMRVLPDELDLGRPGLVDRLDSALWRWFAEMRDGLTDSIQSTDLPSMLASAGLEVVGSRLARQHFDAPLSDDARRVVIGHLRRLRDQLDGRLDDDDLDTLDILTNPDDARGVLYRSDVFVTASRQILIARRIAAPAG